MVSGRSTRCCQLLLHRSTSSRPPSCRSCCDTPFFLSIHHGRVCTPSKLNQKHISRSTGCRNNNCGNSVLPSGRSTPGSSSIVQVQHTDPLIVDDFQHRQASSGTVASVCVGVGLNLRRSSSGRTMATFAAASGVPGGEDYDESSSEGEWSDEAGGDAYLAEALAADPYLQGSGGRTSSSPSGPPAASVDGQGVGRGPSRAVADGMRTLLVHHPACELHDIPGHPERPGRVRAIMNSLMRKFPGIHTSLAPEVKIEQVLLFHTQAHVDRILKLCERSEKRQEVAARKALENGGGTGGGRRQSTGYSAHTIMQIDPDTGITPGSRGAIFRAAGAACFAVDEVMSGRVANAFCCVRPPGHHAEPVTPMGFCFFNNAPIGALHAQAEHGVERVAVVDIDVHHGNGTQASFKANPTTFYASTHQGPAFYPGTGYDHIKGVAKNIVNVSMGGGQGSESFRRAYSEKILPALEAFRPGVIVISAGFDAHKDDPLSGISLNADDYGWVTTEICAVANRVCEGRVVSVLEGGYNLQAISDSAVAHVQALREAGSSPSPSPSSSSSSSSSPPPSSSSVTSSGVTSAAPPTPNTTPTAAGSTAAGTKPFAKRTEENEASIIDELGERLAAALNVDETSGSGGAQTSKTQNR